MNDLSRLEESARDAQNPDAPRDWWRADQLHSTGMAFVDKAFIAQCSPATILALIERLRAAEERVAKREHAVFEHGWRTAASWSDRTDLFFDTGSPMYVKDRQAALALLDQVEAAGIDGEAE